VRAYVRIATTPTEDKEPKVRALLMAALNGASFSPHLPGVSFHCQSPLEDDLSDGIDPAIATVVRMAASGCSLSATLGFEPQMGAPEQMLALQETLLTMIDQAAVVAEQQSVHR
jgi:hypothetical protein